MNHLIVTVAEFNAQQNKDYLAYFQKCIDNCIEPDPQSRYFDTCPYKTGYVIRTHAGYLWRKTKKAILAYHGIN